MLTGVNRLERMYNAQYSGRGGFYTRPFLYWYGRCTSLQGRHKACPYNVSFVRLRYAVALRVYYCGFGIVTIVWFSFGAEGGHCREVPFFRTTRI